MTTIKPTKTRTTLTDTVMTGTAMTRIAIFTVLIAATLATTPAASQEPVAKSSYSIEVSGARQWIDTNIDLRTGEKLRFIAEGTITYSNAKANHFGPEGIPRSLADVIHQYAVTNGAHGELIGRLGSGDVAEAFEIGTSGTYTAPVAGRLFLGINQSMRDAEGATGSFAVK